MAELFESKDERELFRLASTWDRLASREDQHIPTFSDLTDVIARNSAGVHLVGLRNGSEISSLAAFLIYNTRHRFWFGESEILRLPMKVASLYGCGLMGEADLRSAEAMLKLVAADKSIDAIMLPEIAQSNIFYELVAGGGWGAPSSVSRYRMTRRLAELPPDVSAYWGSLRSSTRKAGLRDRRMFERLSPDYTIFTTPAAATEFLPRAQRLSSRTYQHHLGFGIENTPVMRHELTRLAQEGRLRCYLASVDGVDVAYAWGNISHGVFNFRMTGFDPRLARYSPGKAILVRVIEDLIETRSARTFDFSGRDMEFKERFSTRSVECASVILARWRAPRGVAAVAIDRSFNIPKKVAQLLFTAGQLNRLKRILRGGARDAYTPEEDFGCGGP
jgi:hypothetical protein